MLAFENNCFCFQVTPFFTKKVKFIQNVYKEGHLFDKKTYNWKTNCNCVQKLTYFFFFFFLDIITLMLLAKFEFDMWFHFFKKTRKYQKIEFPLKPDGVIVMSSNVHEWKGKPRSIVWCNRSLKRKLHLMIVSNIATSKRFLLYHIDLQLTL